MKKLLLTLMTGCAVMTAVAQNPKGKFSLRPMAGVSVSTFGQATIGGVYHTKVGFTGGAELEYGVNDWLGLSLGAIYSQQGAKIDTRFFFYEEDEGGNVIIEDSKIDGKLKCDYLNLPLMANIYIPAVRGLAVKAGIQVGILVNGWMNTDIDFRKDVNPHCS